MQIPKRAINKAIKGGWEWNGSSHIKFNENANEWIVLGGTKYGVELLFAEQIALDPTFWRALRKVRGWRDEPVDVFQDHNISEWQRQALNFYDLILTGGDVEAYWKEILSEK